MKLNLCLFICCVLFMSATLASTWSINVVNKSTRDYIVDYNEALAKNARLNNSPISIPANKTVTMSVSVWGFLTSSDLSLHFRSKLYERSVYFGITALGEKEDLYCKYDPCPEMQFNTKKGTTITILEK